VIAAAGGDLRAKTVAVLGVAFKPNTDDMRDAPSLEILPRLISAGAKVRAFDPEAMTNAAAMIPGVEWVKDAYATLPGADVLVIITEWNEFRALDLARVKAALAQPVIVDLRNIYRPDEMAEAGFDYYSIGRSATVSA